MKYYLGLDNGGTATKAAVFDENGREVAVAGMDTAMLVPKPGFTERDLSLIHILSYTYLMNLSEK